MTFARLLVKLAPLLPHLWVRDAAPLPLPDDARLLLTHGLVDDAGALTGKGRRVLSHVQALADTVDLPLA